MLIENGIVRVGAEIEVVAWKRGTKYQDTAKRLIDAGFMEGNHEQWETWHQYNCTCRFGCARIKKGDLLLPNPLVSMQYDASLPDLGAEFIVSPVLLINGMQEMKKVYDIVCKDAIWSDKKQAMRGGGMASPSIHLHVSAVNPGYQPMPYAGPDPGRNNEIADALHALSMFAIELIALSDIPTLRRGLAFRQPWRNADGRGRHHGFIHVRQMVPNELAYIEWRMWEAAYNDWNYFETAAYLAAALTRALLKPDTINTLMETGYANRVDQALLEAAIANNDTEAALALVSPIRLRALRQLIENELHDDLKGTRKIIARFEEVEARVF